MMGRTAGWLVVFLLPLTVLEVWVYSMERNVRVRALRMHVLMIHQLIGTAGCWFVWKRVTKVVRSYGPCSVGTAVRAALLLLLGSSQLSVALGLLFVDREPALVTRISNTCLGLSLFLCVSLAATDLASLSLGKIFGDQIFPRVRRRENKGTGLGRSEQKLRLLVALVVAVGLSFAGLLGVAQFTVERLDIPVKGLNARLNGTTIVQLSDIHLGGYTGRSTLQRIVDRVNQLHPDIVVITGDLVDGAVVYMREIVKPLNGLKAKHGVYFSTGE